MRPAIEVCERYAAGEASACADNLFRYHPPCAPCAILLGEPVPQVSRPLNLASWEVMQAARRAESGAKSGG